MDDDVKILDMAGRILADMGYETDVSSEGMDALNRYKAAFESGAPYDVVILDLTIPGGVGGQAVMEKLLQVDPNVKAIVSSGYSNDPVMADARKFGFCSVVPKPYTEEQLARAFNDIFARDHVQQNSEPERSAVQPQGSSEIPGDIEEKDHANKGKVLVMDDLESLLEMIALMLENLGYEAETCTDGIGVIECYRKAFDSGNPFNLVILDLNIPGGMGGLEVVSDILEIDPSAKVIVSTGDPANPIVENYEQYGFSGVLSKPFKFDQLSELLGKFAEEGR